MSEVKFVTHYATVNGGQNNDKDITIPNGAVYSIRSVSYAIPTDIANYRAIVYWDGTGLNKIIDASYGNKFAEFDPPGVVLIGDGIKILKLRLTNGGLLSSITMGMTIFYEEI